MIDPSTMFLRDCLVRFHLMFLTIFVMISFTLIIIGGTLSAWCVHYGSIRHCYSLFYSTEPAFSCQFKLLPAAILFCLSLSLLMFSILILFQICRKYGDVTHKEYKTLVRGVNILLLSVAIILIMIVFSLWFHSPSTPPKSFLLVRAMEKSDGSVGPLEFQREFLNESNFHLLHQSVKPAEYSLNHGPNLFFAAFVLLLFTLITFISTYRIS